jgi:prevent-host-death family protein
MILRMRKPRSVSVTEAARNFADLVNRAYYKGETIVLLKNGTPVAQITPPARAEGKSKADFLAAWERRPRLSSDDADSFARAIEAARAELPPRDPWA